MYIRRINASGRSINSLIYIPRENCGTCASTPPAQPHRLTKRSEPESRWNRIGNRFPPFRQLEKAELPVPRETLPVQLHGSCLSIFELP